jgi:hypothetical protein
MGRNKREYPVDKTTVYYLESDLNKIDPKNRFRALRIAKEISLRAVSSFIADYETSKRYTNQDIDYFIDEYFNSYLKN